MDRFIVINLLSVYQAYGHLKSNMDRFIGPMRTRNTSRLPHLKSNMDRFIVLYI